MYRRFSGFLLTLSIILTMVPTGACATDNILEIKQSAEQIKNNEKVDITICLNLSEPIRGIQFTVSFDFGKFEVYDIVKGEAAYDAMVSRIDTDTFGQVSVAAAYDSEYQYDGDLCTITLLSREKTGLGESEVKIRGITATDADNNNVKYDDIKTAVGIYADDYSDSDARPGVETAAPETSISTENPTVVPGGTSSAGTSSHRGSSGGNGVSKSGAGNATPLPTTIPEREPQNVGVSEPSKDGVPDKIGFIDISNHWAEKDIVYLYNEGIINGVSDTEFMPEKNVTRAEFVKMISKIAEFNPVADNPFDDIEENDWYYEPVLSAYSAGIVNGYDTVFLPEQNITREEMAVIADRCIKFMGLEDSISNSGQIEFNDEDSIADWSKEAVLRMAKLGILNGTDRGFEPKNNTTRAQAASVIKRIYLLK